MGPNAVIFDERTRGMDVGAKSEIYPIMRALADAVIKRDVLKVIKPLVGKGRVKTPTGRVRITSRYTTMEPQITAATQYVYDKLIEAGLPNVRYHPWQYGPYVGRHVIAEIPGTAEPERVLVVSAHVDNQPGGKRDGSCRAGDRLRRNGERDHPRPHDRAER